MIDLMLRDDRNRARLQRIVFGLAPFHAPETPRERLRFWFAERLV